MTILQFLAVHPSIAMLVHGLIAGHHWAELAKLYALWRR